MALGGNRLAGRLARGPGAESGRPLDGVGTLGAAPGPAGAEVVA